VTERLVANDSQERAMPDLTHALREFARSERGATMAEYGILIVVIAGIAIFVLANLNTVLQTLFGKFSDRVNSVS
jgi:Flp pilus assembly pilin Flp